MSVDRRIFNVVCRSLLLFAACCVLLNNRCLLSVACRALFVVAGLSAVVACCSRCVVCRLLFGACCVIVVRC